MRQKRPERFWTASAGREAANPRDGVSNVVHRRILRRPQPLRGVALCRPIPGLHRFATCLRQSKFVPDEFVAMLILSATEPPPLTKGD